MTIRKCPSRYVKRRQELIVGQIFRFERSEVGYVVVAVKIGLLIYNTSKLIRKLLGRGFMGREIKEEIFQRKFQDKIAKEYRTDEKRKLLM